MRIVVYSSLGAANRSISWVIRNYIQSLEEGQELLCRMTPEVQNLEGFFEFRIDDNLLNPDYQDLTILVHDYTYIERSLQYRLRYSIYNRRYRYKENHALNPKPPDLQVIVHDILPVDHSEFLSFDDLNEIDERIMSETLQFSKSMLCLKESITEAMKTHHAINAYTGPDKVTYQEDPNLKDVNHLAETIRQVCNLNIGDLPSDRDLSKDQVVEIVELVERELLSRPSVIIKPGDPRAIRVKDENQLIEELEKIGFAVLKEYAQIGASLEEAIMKSLFMWDGWLNIDKVCRKKDIHGIEPQNRMQVHNLLVNKSNSNPWIRKGFTSARFFRQDQKDLKDYSWIPLDSPYLQ